MDRASASRILPQLSITQAKCGNWTEIIILPRENSAVPTYYVIALR